MLTYARNDGSSIRPTTITIAVSKAALIVSYFHMGAAIIVALLLGAEARGTVHEAELIVALFFLQLPFLIAVLVLGVLGHRPIGGRQWAGKAMWISSVTPGASAVRTWPHHFDIATLILLPESGTSGRRTIGVGQSPGDNSYAEPYWYVGPYPYPATTAFPPLAGSGHWHTEGWVGAALPASDFVAAKDQQAQVAAFVESGIAACRMLLGG